MGGKTFVGLAGSYIVGAWVFYKMLDIFSQTDPGFSQYGWYLFGAHIIGGGFVLSKGLVSG